MTTGERIAKSGILYPSYLDVRTHGSDELAKQIDDAIAAAVAAERKACEESIASALKDGPSCQCKSCQKLSEVWVNAINYCIVAVGSRGQ